MSDKIKKMTRVQKIEVYPFTETVEERNHFYQFYRKNATLYTKALNLIYSQLYAENILTNNIATLDTEYQKRLDTAQEKLEILINQDTPDKVKIEKVKKEINKLRNAKLKEARVILDEAIGLKGQTRTRDIAKQLDFDFSDFIDAANQKATKDFSNDYVELVTGQRSSRTYRSSFTKAILPFRGRDIRIVESDGKYFIHLPKGFVLAVNLGRKPRLAFNAIQTLQGIISGEMKLAQSPLVLDGKKFYLNLTVSFEKDYANPDLVENKSLVIEYTDTASGIGKIQNKDIFRFGDTSFINETKTKLSILRDREKSKAVYAKGGHGRNAKVNHDRLEAIRQRESNFVKTYNNQISKKIVTFALRNKCSNIIILPFVDKTREQAWAYYQLHLLIQQKAELYGITVNIQPTPAKEKEGKPDES